jgi:hypothetical protein
MRRPGKRCTYYFLLLVVTGRRCYENQCQQLQTLTRSFTCCCLLVCCCSSFCTVSCLRALLLEELRAALATAHEELVSTGGRSSSSSTGGSFQCLPLVIDSVARHSSIHVVTARVDTSGLGPRDRDSPRERDFVVLTVAPLRSAAELAEDRLPRTHLSGENRKI